MKPCNPLLALALLACAFFISGCGAALNPYHENFNCKAPAGDGRCLDTPDAYEEAVNPPSKDKEGARQQASTSSRHEVQETRYKLLSELLSEPKAPLLEPPKVLRVLLLPYRGANEELFMARHVYIKVEEARWVLTDLAEDK
ncbi:MAG: hypothetical protein A2286_14630 [Gammaproteobacteria bacterium RIFOXYA12_FULL_61_12]|nr:MAG: hypothetical protein A2286_14630 [Gammaproteobacteria bacterium RIFOXYA12_FULL_61_12]